MIIWQTGYPSILAGPGYGFAVEGHTSLTDANEASMPLVRPMVNIGAGWQSFATAFLLPPAARSYSGR
jgi:hypothetical protein